MDRPLDENELRGQRLRVMARWGVAVLGIVIVAWLIRTGLRPGLKLSSVRTAVVDRGEVEAATLCSGTVQPAADEVIACPFDSRVRQVLKQPGAQLAIGDAVLILDDTEVRLAVERLEDEIRLNQNRRRELELGLEGRLSEIRGRHEIQEKRLALLEARTRQLATLYEKGLISVHELHQAELDENIARIELRQLGESAEKEQETTRTKLEGLGIENSLLQRDLADKRSQLERATVRAVRAGVLTWIQNEEGASVRDGEILARVADLSRFEVDVTTSDLHAGRIEVGLPVRVEIGESRLAGTVSSIPPAIEKGALVFKVQPDEPDHHLLRPNLRVDVWVITDTREGVLRVEKGPFVSGSGAQKVFVIRGESARRTDVRIGVAGIDGVEGVSGLEEGDRVVISGMTDYLHLEQIRLK